MYKKRKYRYRKTKNNKNIRKTSRKNTRKMRGGG
jgi:hypothetical protein